MHVTVRTLHGIGGGGRNDLEMILQALPNCHTPSERSNIQTNKHQGR